MQVKSGGAEVTREGDAKLTGGVAIVQGTASCRRVRDLRRLGSPFRRRGRRRVSLAGRPPQGGAGKWDASAPANSRGRIRTAEAARAGLRRQASDDVRGDLKLREVRFTTCPAGKKDWELRASAIDIDQKTQQGKGRNVRIDLKGVPILYTPVISFPVGDARKSGFLFPSFGNSDKSGFELGVPYYFNLAPNYDLRLTPFLLSRRGFGLGTEFRYLTERSRGDFDTRYLPGTI